MAKITAPVAEFTGKRGNVAFVDGVGETDDINAIAYFKRHGYTVEGEKSAANSGPAYPEGEPEEAWKADQLKAYAADKGIDLGDAKNKADLVAAIAAAKQQS